MTLGLGTCYVHSIAFLFFLPIYSRGDTNQERTLFKGGHYRLEKGFDRGHYLYLYNLKKRIYLKIVEESFPKKVPKCVKTSSSEIALVLSFVSNHERKPF